jgi:nucleoside-diphosphate-sugar epimerase
MAVTGAASPLGLATMRALLARDPAPRVIGLDTHRANVPGVSWRTVDIRDDS